MLGLLIRNNQLNLNTIPYQYHKDTFQGMRADGSNIWLEDSERVLISLTSRQLSTSVSSVVFLSNVERKYLQNQKYYCLYSVELFCGEDTGAWH